MPIQQPFHQHHIGLWSSSSAAPSGTSLHETRASAPPRAGRLPDPSDLLPWIKGRHHSRTKSLKLHLWGYGFHKPFLTTPPPAPLWLSAYRPSTSSGSPCQGCVWQQQTWDDSDHLSGACIMDLCLNTHAPQSNERRFQLVTKACACEYSRMGVNYYQHPSLLTLDHLPLC